MKQIYFCDQNKSKEIISNLSKRTHKVEYTASIFEYRVEIDFFASGLEILDEEIPAVITHFEDDESYIKMNDGKYCLNLNGYFHTPSILQIAELFLLSEEYLSKLRELESPSCPVDVISTVDVERENAFNNLMRSREVSEDEW